MKCPGVQNWAEGSERSIVEVERHEIRLRTTTLYKNIQLQTQRPAWHMTRYLRAKCTKILRSM